MQTGAIGIWSPQLRNGDPEEAAQSAAELEQLGYGALWVPGRDPGDLEERLRILLSATKKVTVATGIVSIWTNDARATAAIHARLTSEFPGRFLLGIGVSHAPLVDASGAKYQRPYSEMVAYLDALDATDPPVPQTERVLAALKPKMLALARERSLGSHPYLVSPAHTRIAREALGPDALLAPELTVVLENDADTAREVARQFLTLYLQLPNYVDNLLQLGFERDDVENGGSDKLVDEVIAWGDVDAIRAKIDAHHAAGADHVALQVITGDRSQFPREQWRRLAPA